MRNARRVVGILGALAGGVLSCGGVLAGCGGDDSGVVSSADGGDATADGGRDAPTIGVDARADVSADGQMVDARADTAAPLDGGRDVFVPDATVDARPEGAADATLDTICTTCVDARADATLDAMDAMEATPDVTVDAPLDTSSDVALDAGADAPFDAMPDVADVGPDRSAELAFPTQVANALCAQLALCCFPDGGTSQFDMNGCSAQIVGSGYQFSSVGQYAINNGNILYDPEAGAACLGSINSLAGGCMVTSALQPQLINNCFGALTGTLAAGAACTASLECAPGNFCAPTDGGATGVCAALHSVGQPCGAFGDNATQNQSSEICSYRASGNTGMTCRTIDGMGNFTEAGTWSCQPQYAVNAICNIDTDCVAPMICDTSLNGGTCVSTGRVLLAPSNCGTFILDAGGGG
ncbi:MAG: hypothetical protein M3O50_04430 [Myxococcota bacterium]|nr:hypothetical protein [Myxococcota bacterium]